MTNQPHGLGRIVDVEQIELETLVGDARDLMLQQARDLKTHEKWTALPEHQQRDVIDKADRMARKLVREIATKLAVKEHRYVHVKRGAWTVKDGVKIVVTCAETPENIKTIMSGTDVPLLVFVDTKDAQGERAELKALPDQPDLVGDAPVFDNTRMGEAA